MEKTLQELLKAYVDSQKFDNTTKIVATIKNVSKCTPTDNGE